MTPATDKQMAYLRALLAAKGLDIHEYLVDHGCSELKGFPVPVKVAAVPSKDQASRLIGELAPSSASRPAYRGRSRYSSRRSTFSARCTHEDYPCCGCDR